MEHSKLVADVLRSRNSPVEILALLRAYGLTAESLKADLPEADAPLPYARRTLIATSECEIMVARWAPERVCAPHDHGASAGWVFFLDGRFHEIAYRWDGHALLESERLVREPGTFSGVTAEEIHSCASERGGISVHVYFPRIKAMRVFDVPKRRTLVVADDCGAWVPLDPEQTRKVIPWSNPAAIARS